MKNLNSKVTINVSNGKIQQGDFVLWMTERRYMPYSDRDKPWDFFKHSCIRIGEVRKISSGTWNRPSISVRPIKGVVDGKVVTEYSRIAIYKTERIIKVNLNETTGEVDFSTMKE